jgi:hypothetical protein
MQGRFTNGSEVILTVVALFSLALTSQLFVLLHDTHD